MQLLPAMVAVEVHVQLGVDRMGEVGAQRNWLTLAARSVWQLSTQQEAVSTRASKE